MTASLIPTAGVLSFLAVLTGVTPLAAQTGYLSPPDPIPAIVTAPPPPLPVVSPNRQTLALITREGLPPIADMAEPEVRLAGFRISPRTNGPSSNRVVYSHAITFQDLATGTQRAVALPPDMRIMNWQWSPDGSHLAFVNVAAAQVELWVADVATARARRIAEGLNGTMGTPFRWLPDNSGVVIARVPSGRGAPAQAPNVPAGPIVQQNEGRVAPARTFQDLLQSPHDEALFDYYFTSRIARVALDGGAITELGEPGIFWGFEPSPNGAFLLVRRVKRPYSYAVPAWAFPEETAVWDARTGRVVHLVADLPLADDLPTAFDAVRQGPRSVQWRSDAPATLAWAEAQDGGDPRREAAVRDRVVLLAAPFTGPPARLIDLEHRFAGVMWGRDDFAMVVSQEWNTRAERRHAVQPATPATAPRLLLERSFEDAYSNPGYPLTTTTATGHSVMLFTADGRGVFLSSVGASERGNYPFLDVMDVASAQTRRLWRAEDPYFETVVTVLDTDGSRIVTRRESLTEPPNLFVRTLPGGTAMRVTDFPDPAPQFAEVQRRLVTYNRADGVQLSGTLYLPPGYEPQRDGPLPMLMWAYPTEFRDAAAAGRITDSPNRFTRPGGSSHLFLLLQGYAIFDNPSMPIIGEGDAEPNDTFVEQLVAGAKAAIDYAAGIGVADPGRVGIGGHSYGAFMTANLLAHSDLFRAGIARSGAYNRTLTPFGFQAEQRTYWEAPETYARMSPFTYAHRVNEPILLIHGAEDDNSGTFPMQTERFYAALRGHGATARYVVLPLESHGYRARESVLHTLREMVDWMDRWVKHLPPRQPTTAPQ
jgi:dipeptidyl aminopeptidase/acylaminoacyl peptidase